MVFTELLKRTGLGLAIAAALSLPSTANAQYWHGGGWHGGGGISPGAAVGLGLGSFALGTALGSAAAYPYYGGYGYGSPYAGYGYSYPAYSSYAPAYSSYSYYGTTPYYGTSYGPSYGYGWGY